jgi:cyclopropane-fatty-acyl-phospholipid synthase
MLLDGLITGLLGPDLPVRVRAYDGTDIGPHDAAATVWIRSPEALKHIARSPGELGFARAYVAGAIDVEGDLFAALDLQQQLPEVKLSLHRLPAVVRHVGLEPWRRPPAVPPEEIKLSRRFRRHTRVRDRAAIAAHYDVGNDFYRLVLGPSMTYSCAVFRDPDHSLEQAQADKHELVCRKLGLEPGMALLDVGCGWGAMVMHAAAHHGVRAVGITISAQQAELARHRVAAAGLDDLVEIRHQDYRDVEGHYDAICSIGMFEHVGEAQLGVYFRHLSGLLAPHGRLLNHQIARPAAPWDQRQRQRAAVAPRGFINRYVFPDGELHDVSTVVQGMQRSGVEVRDVDALREHYALTLRRWTANLEANEEEAVALTSEGRVRVWRLYMAGAAKMFEAGLTQVHQVLGVKVPLSGAGRGEARVGLRPTWTDQAATAPPVRVPAAPAAVPLGA